jgi:hypothetical protein
MLLLVLELVLLTGGGAAGRGSGLTGIVTGYGSGSLAGSRKTESSSLAS